MAKYLLAVHSVEGDVPEQMSAEEMQESWNQIQALEEEMRSAGAWVFGGALHGPDTATVVRVSDDDVLLCTAARVTDQRTDAIANCQVEEFIRYVLRVPPLLLSSQGFERQMATNHLGHAAVRRAVAAAGCERVASRFGVEPRGAATGRDVMVRLDARGTTGERVTTTPKGIICAATKRDRGQGENAPARTGGALSELSLTGAGSVQMKP